MIDGLGFEREMIRLTEEGELAEHRSQECKQEAEAAKIHTEQLQVLTLLYIIVV